MPPDSFDIFIKTENGWEVQRFSLGRASMFSIHCPCGININIVASLLGNHDNLYISNCKKHKEVPDELMCAVLMVS